MNLTDEQCTALRAHLSTMRPWRDECVQREKDRVALMLADPEFVDLFLEPGNEHYYVQSFWQDTKLHALFCLLCELRAGGEPLGYLNKLKDHGKKLLEQRKNADNTDRLGF